MFDSAKIKNIFLLLFGFGLLVLSIWFFDIDEKISTLKGFSLIGVLEMFIIILTLYTLSGVQYSIVLAKEQVHLKKQDIFLLPVTINLWSFLIPFQGALIFSTVFFHKKYKKSISTGLSISVFLYLITIFLTGVLGIFFVLVYDKFSIITLLILGGLILSPLIFSLLVLFQEQIDLQFSNKYLQNVYLFFKKTAVNISILLKNKKLIINVCLIKIVKTLLIGLWYWIISNELGYDLSFLVLVILSLVSEMSLILKITPDNLGVNQLISGGLLAGMGYNAEQGVMITLVASAMTLFIVFSVGLVGNHLFIKELDGSSIKDILRFYKQLKEE